MRQQVNQLAAGGVGILLLAGGVAPLAAAQLEDGEFPANWFHGNAEQREQHAALAGKKAFDLHVTEWMNAEGVIETDKDFDWEQLEGKVVLIDYWATW